jgi:hypothetical protein
MATHAMGHHHPTFSVSGRWLMVGFVSGALAVLLFHQGAAALLHALELTRRAPYSMAATAPFGVPQLWSIAFWGGVWGVLLAAALGRMVGGKLLVAALIFGAVLPTLAGWFVVAPLKGQPIAAGFVPSRMWLGPLINGVWGLGTGIVLMLIRAVFRRRA